MLHKFNNTLIKRHLQYNADISIFLQVNFIFIKILGHLRFFSTHNKTSEEQ